MHGVIIHVRIDPNRENEARRMVREVIVPRATTHHGFMAGYRATRQDRLRPRPHTAAERRGRDLPDYMHPTSATAASN
jgi:hypothetical protein